MVFLDYYLFVDIQLPTRVEMPTTGTELLSSLETLPLELCARILSLLPTHASLRSAVLSCATLHSAFSLAKDGITAAVACTEAGPTFSLLLAVVRVQKILRDSEQTPIDACALSSLINDEESYIWEEGYAPDEAHAIGEVARTARGFEDEFSLRCAPPHIVYSAYSP